METDTLTRPATRQDKLAEFHRADALVNKLDKAAANGLPVDRTMKRNAVEWRTECARNLREHGTEDMG